MERTKNDLSAGLAKLDFMALKRTAGIAYGHALSEIERYVRQLRCFDEIKDNTGRKLTTGWLAEEAERLAISADVYSVILEAERRDTLEVVNKPAIVENSKEG